MIMVQVVKMNSANYLFDNKNTADREYDIQSDIQTGENNAIQYGNNGVVRINGGSEMKCSFNIGSLDNINYSFYGSVKVSEQITIIQAIEEFMTEVTAKLSESTII